MIERRVGRVTGIFAAASAIFLTACSVSPGAQSTLSDGAQGTPSASSSAPQNQESGTDPLKNLLVAAEDVPDLAPVVQTVKQAQADAEFLKTALAELGAACPDTLERLAIGPGFTSPDGLLFATSTAEPACASVEESLAYHRALNLQEEFWRTALSEKLADTGLTVKDFSIREMPTDLGPDTATFEVSGVLAGESDIPYRELLTLVVSPEAVVGINVVTFSPQDKAQETLLDTLVQDTRRKLSELI